MPGCGVLSGRSWHEDVFDIVENTAVHEKCDQTYVFNVERNEWNVLGLFVRQWRQTVVRSWNYVPCFECSVWSCEKSCHVAYGAFWCLHS